MPKFNFNGFSAKRYITTYGTTYFEIFDAIMNKYGAISPAIGRNTIIKQHTDIKTVKKKSVKVFRYTIELIASEEQCQEYLTNILNGGGNGQNDNTASNTTRGF